MTIKKSGQALGGQRPASSRTGKPRSFGEQWTSKGDAFTRSVQQPKAGHRTAKSPKAKP